MCRLLRLRLLNTGHQLVFGMGADAHSRHCAPHYSATYDTYYIRHEPKRDHMYS